MFFFEEEQIVEESLELPKEFVSLCNKETLASAIPLAYLKKRGINKEQVAKWKIGYCAQGEFEGRIIIPSFNMKGEPNFFVARAYSDTERSKKLVLL